MLDINALTAAAVAELNKKQQTTTPTVPANTEKMSNIQEHLLQLQQQQEQKEKDDTKAPEPMAIQSANPEIQMPARHSWEVDWLSSELVKAREEIAKLKEENDQLRLKLETHNKFVVHGSRPIHTSNTDTFEMVKQRAALEALLKNQQQQNLQHLALQQALSIQNAMPTQLTPSTLQQAAISQLASLTQSKPSTSSLPTSSASISTSTPLQELQHQMLGTTTNFKDLQHLVDQASAHSNPQDMTQVEKLLLAVQEIQKNEQVKNALLEKQHLNK